MGIHSGFHCLGCWAAIQVWKWEWSDCLSCEGEWNKGCGDRSSVDEGKLTSKSLLGTRFCSTLLFWSVCFCPLQNESAWCFINLREVGWSGVEHIRGVKWSKSERAERFILYPVCTFPFPPPHGARERLNWWLPHFSSSRCLHVTLIIIHLKWERAGPGC